MPHKTTSNTYCGIPSVYMYMKTKLLTHYLERKNERQMRQKKHDDTWGFIHKGLLSRANKYMREHCMPIYTYVRSVKDPKIKW